MYSYAYTYYTYVIKLNRPNIVDMSGKKRYQLLNEN